MLSASVPSPAGWRATLFYMSITGSLLSLSPGAGDCRYLRGDLYNLCGAGLIVALLVYSPAVAWVKISVPGTGS